MVCCEDWILSLGILGRRREGEEGFFGRKYKGLSYFELAVGKVLQQQWDF